MATFIYPYTTGSKSAEELAKAMGVKRMLRSGSTVQDTPNNKIINWGSGDFPISRYLRTKVINPPGSVNDAINKLTAFRILEREEINIPAFTTSYDVASRRWLDNGHYVASRALLTGNSSRGLVITNKEEELPKDSPLYTKYIPKKYEYRIHVVDGEVIIIQRKVFPSGKDSTGVNWKIRDIAQGFVFQTEKVENLPNKSILTEAINAVDALGLDFGGVDIIWNATYAMPFVLEVNTAPGIEGTDLTSYAKALTSLVERITAETSR